MEHPKIAEYRDVNDSNRSTRKLIKGCQGQTGWYYCIVEVSEGYEPAGSMARHVPHCFRVCATRNDWNGSQAYKTLQEAETAYRAKLRT